MSVRDKLRTFEQVRGYAPNQAFIGNLRPEELWETARPWWGGPDAAAPASGPYGEIIDQRSFYELMREVDLFDLVRLGEEPRAENGDLALYDGEDGRRVRARHDEDERRARPPCRQHRLQGGRRPRLRFMLAPRASTPSHPLRHRRREEAVGDRHNAAAGRCQGDAETVVCERQRQRREGFCTSPSRCHGGARGRAP
jgi:hypothetical protein